MVVHGRVYEPKQVGDDDGDLLYFMDETIQAAYDTRRDPLSSDESDSVRVCLVCADVEGHLSGCPIETLEKVLKLSRSSRRG